MSKIAIFDADGVAIKLREKYFSQRLAEDFGVDPKLVISLFENEFYKCVLGEMDLKEVLKDYLPKWNWKGSVDELFEYWWQGENTANREILEIIKQLREKGVRCYLATDQEKYRAEYLMKIVGLEKYFDGAFFSYELRLSKASKEFWEQALKRLGNPNPKDVYFFDDEKENIGSALESGINGNLFSGANTLNNFNWF